MKKQQFLNSGAGNSALILSALFALYGPAQATEADARLIFATGTSTSLTFKNAKIIDDISSSFPHYSANGRTQLLSELERTGIVDQATKKGASLTSTVDSGSLNAFRRVAPQGGESFELSGPITLQWQRCVNATCVPVGKPKVAQVSGIAVGAMVNGRPSYRIDGFRLDGAGTTAGANQ